MTRGQMLQACLAQRNDRRVAGEARAYEAMKRFVFAHPDLKTAWDAWITERMAAARAAVNRAPAPGGEAGAAFRRALAEAMTREGLAPDAFTYRPLCPLCGDTGAVGGDAQRFCTCVLNDTAKAMKETTGIDPDFTFANFDLSVFPDKPLPTINATQRALMEGRRAQCLDYAEAFPGDGSRSLLLMGGTGLGKTYLLHAMANTVADRGFTVLMTTAYQLVRASLERREGEDPLALYQEADFLLIDDLGSEPLYQKITVETLFALINDRMATHRPMAFSTNLSPAELQDRYGARLASRLLDRRAVRVLRLEGEDVRLARR